MALLSSCTSYCGVVGMCCNHIINSAMQCEGNCVALQSSWVWIWASVI